MQVKHYRLDFAFIKQQKM